MCSDFNSTYICKNEYGLIVRNDESNNEFIVRTFVPERLPHSGIFMTDVYGSVTFAFLPTPEVFPQMEQVFHYLTTHQFENCIQARYEDGICSMLAYR